MTFSYSVSPKGHLLVAIGALLFAQDQPGVSAATHRKIGLAIASARRDLARLKTQRTRRRVSKGGVNPPASQIVRRPPPPPSSFRPSGRKFGATKRRKATALPE
jgi:hypothetical protein